LKREYLAFTVGQGTTAFISIGILASEAMATMARHVVVAHCLANNNTILKKLSLACGL